MTASLKFLHSMRERAYLESALAQGLMLTRHKVEFKPSANTDDIATFFEAIFPVLQQRLIEIGKPWDALSEERRRVVCSGLGAMSGEFPMLCFTEAAEGRDVSNHYDAYGAYGVVVRRDWLERNGADRVIYAGHNSELTRRLYRVLAQLQIANLYPDANAEVVFHNRALAPALDLLAYIETRDHVAEFEWRISGRHGFMVGGDDAGRRLPLSLADIETVLVDTPAEVAEFEALMANMTTNGGSTPIVSRRPQRL